MSINCQLLEQFLIALAAVAVLCLYNSTGTHVCEYLPGCSDTARRHYSTYGTVLAFEVLDFEVLDLGR